MVIAIGDDGTLTATAARALAPGTRLTQNRGPRTLPSWGLETRDAWLRKHRHLACACTACEGERTKKANKRAAAPPRSALGRMTAS